MGIGWLVAWLAIILFAAVGCETRLDYPAIDTTHPVVLFPWVLSCLPALRFGSNL